jgi:LPXTG-motif cell wall-anchored protein
MKRIVLALAAITSLVALAPGTVNAQSYVPGQPQTLTYSPGPIYPGQAITATAGNFCPGALVTFLLGGTSIGTATANANGVAVLNTTAPATTGTFAGSAQSTTPCAFTATASLVVSPVPTTTVGGGLPATGSEPMNWTRAGGVAVLIGLGLIGATRLRRRPQAV